MTSTKDNSLIPDQDTPLRKLILKYSVPPHEQEVQRLARIHFIRQQCQSPLQKQHLEMQLEEEKKRARERGEPEPEGLEYLAKYSFGIHV